MWCSAAERVGTDHRAFSVKGYSPESVDQWIGLRENLEETMVFSPRSIGISTVQSRFPFHIFHLRKISAQKHLKLQVQTRGAAEVPAKTPGLLLKGPWALSRGGRGLGA